MSRNVLFIEILLKNVPSLKGMYDAHICENEELLPHVFMGDIARYAVSESEKSSAQNSLKKLFDCFESVLGTDKQDIEELIVVSFVENMIGETKAIRHLKPLMKQKLRALVEQVCEK